MATQNFYDFYKNKRIFITGHSGFKGSWLTSVLLHLGATIKGYSLPPNTQPNLFTILGLENKIQNVFGDILDAKKLEKELISFKPDIVLHLAAQPIVRRSYKEPVLTIQTNLLGSVNLFEAVLKCPSVKSVVNITTDKCYLNLETNRAYKEDDALGGYDPYSASKAMSEIATNSYRQSFFNNKNIALASCRAGNVIGGGDWSENRLIPDAVKAFSQNKVLEIRNPKATRPWQFVLEPLFGYLLVAKNIYEDISLSSAYNFGPKVDSGKQVEETLQTFIKYYGTGTYKIHLDNTLHEAQLLQLDISKVNKIFAWQPVYNFEETLQKTAIWYKTFYEGKDVKKLTIEQIKEYLDVAKFL